MDNPIKRKHSVSSFHSPRLSTIIDNPKIQNLPKLLDPSTPTPELYIWRKNVFEEDKKKKISSISIPKIPLDIPHLIDLKKSNKLLLPKTLEDMKKWIKENHFRLPTGPKEIYKLEKWLFEMKKTHLPDFENLLIAKIIPAEVIEKAETIFFLAFSEILRQISVQSKTRADLLKTVIETLHVLWTKQSEYLLDLLVKQKENYNQTAENLRENYQQSFEILKKNIFDLEKNKETQKIEKENLLNENFSLKDYISKVNWEYEDFFIYKNKISKRVNVSCQTEEIEKSFDDKIGSSDDSLTEDSLLSEDFEFPSDISYSAKQVSIQKTNSKLFETKKEEFVKEFYKAIDGLDIPLDVNVINLANTVKEEIKDYKTWLSAFKIALNLGSSNKPSLLQTAPIVSKNTMATPSNKDFKILSKIRSTYKRKTNVIKGPSDNTALLPSKEVSSAISVINNILAQPLSKLQKLEKIKNKKLLKNINNYIYLAISKKYSKPMNFADFVYTNLLSKYNIKAMAERKFSELITGCLMQFLNNSKIVLFVRALKVGEKMNLKNFSNEACEMVIKLYEFMIESKIGVIIDNKDPLSIKNYPASRAFECVKQKFEGFSNKNELNSLFEQIEKITIQDPSFINKSGLVNIDSFIELAINCYEKCIENIRIGAKTCTKIVSDYNYLTKGEVFMIFRHFCPGKLQGIIKTLSFDEQNELEIEEFIEACVNNGVLSIEAVNEFFNAHEKDTKKIFDYLQKNEASIISTVLKTNEITLNAEEWSSKIEDLMVKLRGMNSVKHLQLWFLMKKELEYLKSNI